MKRVACPTVATASRVLRIARFTHGWFVEIRHEPARMLVLDSVVMLTPRQPVDYDELAAAINGRSPLCTQDYGPDEGGAVVLTLAAGPGRRPRPAWIVSVGACRSCGEAILDKHGLPGRRIEYCDRHRPPDRKHRRVDVVGRGVVNGKWRDLAGKMEDCT